MEKLWVLEYSLGRMEISMKVSGVILLSMEKDMINFIMVINIEVSINKENLMDMVFILGQTELPLKDNLKTV